MYTKNNLHNTDKNWCTATSYTVGHGQADGSVILVKAECACNLLLPMDQQDEVYRNAGVSTGPKGKAKFVKSHRRGG